jgi:hypothetical protein
MGDVAVIGAPGNQSHGLRLPPLGRDLDFGQQLFGTETGEEFGTASP